MCKAQDEGGQRCAAHAKTALTKAEATFRDRGDEESLHALIDAHTQYASTAEGREVVLANITNGEPGPGELDPAIWQRIADDGQALRERNKAVGDAIKAAQAKGDAFHADVQEKWGKYKHVPAGVRGPKGLARFLDEKNEQMMTTGLCIEEDTARRNEVHGLLGRLYDGPFNKDATFEDRTPRNEEEGRAWEAYLRDRMRAHDSMNAARRDALAEHNATMAKFDNPGVPTDGSGLERALTAQGALVRLRQPDGTLSEQEYVVSSNYAIYDDTGAPRRTGAALVPLNPTTAAPEGGEPDPGAQYAFRGEGMSRVGGQDITADMLAPASPETIERLGAPRLEVRNDQYILDVGPNQYHSTVRAWTPAADEVARFDNFRKEWARQHAPYRAPKPEGEPRTMGDRLRGLLS